MKKFSYSNLLTAAMVALLLSMLIFPDVKATMIKGLMQVGLFQAETDLALQEEPVFIKDVAFSDLSGRKIEVADLKGKVVFINFWATWCPPCRAEMPAINKLYKKFKNNKNVVFIMADADGKLAAAKKYMDRKNYELPVHQVVSSIPDVMFSGSLPTTVILDKSGRMVYKGVGAADYSNQKVVDFINHLLKS